MLDCGQSRNLFCLDKGVIRSGSFENLRIPFLIIYSILLWVLTMFYSHIEQGIASNTLTTTGVYAIVRNPIYAGFMFACTGVVYIANNL